MIYYRIKKYLKRNGLRKTLRQLLIKALTSLKVHKYVLYCTDSPPASTVNMNGLTVLMFNDISSAETANFKDLCSYFTKEIFQPIAIKNFNKNATLWVLTNRNNETLGIVWSIVGNTVSSHFFPLSQNDAHLFSNEILLPHRGKGYNTILLNYVVSTLKEKNISRIHIETAVDNFAEQKSLNKTLFKEYAIASKFSFLGKQYTRWYTHRV
jgi:hypothetical protein